MIIVNRKDNSRNKKSYSNREAMRGYTMVELLFYIVLFSILSLAVIDAMITMTKAFKETTIQAELVESSTVMERISREVREAYGINTITTNDLKLDTKDGAGVNKTVKFSLSGSNVQFLENSVLTGNLNTPNITVTGLTFIEITTVAGKAVKIILTVRSNNDTLNRSVDFYDTIVLRGVY